MSTSCHCLCTVNHPDQSGICTAEATGALRFSDFPEDSLVAELGSVSVQMCTPCRLATLLVTLAKKGG